MHLITAPALTALVCGMAVLTTQPAGAQQPLSDRALVASARSAAPASISDRATIVDLQQRTLHEGTNGWVCMPDDPNIPNDSPMCLDEPWLGFVTAYMSKRPPEVTRIGFGYMLRGDMPVSNTDPFSTGPTAENQWLADGGPHIMMLVPDAALLNEMSTDPHNGGPWVMWKGTPYAHVMIPAERRK